MRGERSLLVIDGLYLLAVACFLVDLMPSTVLVSV